MSVHLVQVCESDMTTLRDMVMSYAVELSKFYPAGVKPPLMVADHWVNRSTPNVFLIMDEGKAAGFIAMAVRPCLPGVYGNYVQEFYVKTAYRKGATAFLAGGALMKQFPGEWCTDVLAGNATSLRFTRAMTHRYGHLVNERPITTDFGPATRFRWRVS